VSRRGPLAAFFAFGFFWGAWAALVPAVQDAVGASKGELGLALLFVAIGSLPSMLVTGRELDRHGARLIPILLAGLGVAAVLPAFAGTLPVLALSLFAIGVLGGGLDVAINAAVSELEVRRGARLMQLAHALFSAGLLVGAIASGLSRQLGADRLEVLGAVAVVLVAAAALNLGHERVERKPAATRRGLSLSRAAIPLGIACAAAFVIEGGMENWGALFLERELAADPAVSALAPGAYAFAMMLGRLSGQWLERLLGDTLLLMGAFGVAFVGLVTVALAENVPLAVVAFFVGGAGISIAAPALFGGGGRNAAPEERGRAVATVTTIGYLGFLVGPPFVGGAAEAVGLRAAFAALALVAIALVVATPRLGLGRRT
jgi:MFS family permease